MSGERTSEICEPPKETSSKLSPREKISVFISKHDLKICGICYVVGIAWFLSLVHPDMNAHTYFSENALLPGLVKSDFHHDNGAANYFQQLKEEVSKQKLDHGQRFKIPVMWLTKVMNEIGLDTYVQNYSFKYPNNILKDKVFNGQNVYGILRAVRTPGTEALVLSSPYRPEPFGENTLPGIALMLGIAKSFRSHLYWAKDVIFLVTEDDEIGMQAWLSAYHHTFNSYIMPGELPGRSGAIQAALNLEISTDTVSRLDIRIEGLNGQLPNLDFVNTAVRLCKREGIVPTLQKRTDHLYLKSLDGLLHSLKTMFLQMSRLATGSPSGNHGLFHRYNIEAITLRSIKLKSAKVTPGLTDIGRVIEGIFRSLNNLLERFHQSFFFYLLPSVESYVSIGVYMPPFGVLTLPVAIKAISLWLSRNRSYGADKPTPSDDDDDDDTSGHSEKKKDDSKSAGKTSLKTDEQQQRTAEFVSAKDKSVGKSATAVQGSKKGLQPSGASELQLLESSGSLFCYFVYLLTATFYGMFAFYGLSSFVRMSQMAHIEVHTAVAYGFAAIHLLVVASPFDLNRRVLASKRYKDTMGQLKVDARLIQCLALILFGILLGSTAVINISLAVFIAAIAVPVTIIVCPTRNRLLNGFKRLLLVIISPFSAICLASLISVLLNQKSTATHPIWSTITEAWSNVEHGILQSAVQMDMLDNWTYGLVSLAYLTNWALFWQVMSCDPIS